MKRKVRRDRSEIRWIDCEQPKEGANWKKKGYIEERLWKCLSNIFHFVCLYFSFAFRPLCRWITEGVRSQRKPPHETLQLPQLISCFRMISTKQFNYVPRVPSAVWKPIQSRVVDESSLVARHSTDKSDTAKAAERILYTKCIHLIAILRWLFEMLNG